MAEGRSQSILTGVFLTFREAVRKPADGPFPAPHRDRLDPPASKATRTSRHTAHRSTGLSGWYEALARELAHKDVTVNAICPGFIETPMLDRSVANIVEKTGVSTETAREQLAANNPQKRFIQPHEVTSTALWLCSDAACSVTGQAIAISGGEI